jgi:ABC-type sugar transport system substrate-binding protein
MKGLKTLTAMLLGVALLATAAPAAAKAAAFSHYVACGSSKLSDKSNPSHSCSKASRKGAFFQSNDADVYYSVCVKFPTGKNLCAKAQKATVGTLYVNKITSNIPGKHKVTWFVGGKRVGLFVFKVTD